MATKKDVEYYAALSRLEFSEEEKESAARWLNNVLEYVNRLEGLDTNKVKPTYHVIHADGAMRKDTAGPSMEREKVLVNAPDKKRGFFRVPRIIE